MLFKLVVDIEQPTFLGRIYCSKQTIVLALPELCAAHSGFLPIKERQMIP